MEKIQIRRMLLVLALISLLTALGVVIWLLLRGPDQPGSPGPPAPAPRAGQLKIPPLLEDLDPDPGVARYILEAEAGETDFFQERATGTLGYNGSYLGPVLKMRQGERVNIEVRNKLDDPTTIHWHGLVVDGSEDGGPHQGIGPGESWNPSFTVDQPAATLWFHPHLMGTTADQVYYGLAGLIYIEDEVSDRLALPKTYGVDDIPLIVQDRRFRSNGSFDYQTTMMGVVPGDTILVNGTVDPSVMVARGNIRFRLLNASNSENFTFRLSDGSLFQQIASDGGFLAAPVIRQTIFLSPGERAEVVIDFSDTSTDNVFLLAGSREILKIELTGQPQATAGLPQVLREITPIEESPDPPVRYFELQSMGISGTINRKYFDMERIDERVRLNETELWVIRTTGGMMMQSGGHPFHVHGTQFQVVARNGRTPPPGELGFKDTVFVDEGEEVVIRVRFTHPGVFMYHCHILEHEDNGMMGQFSVR